ncbi:bile acid:sodium symporter family protein [Rhizorhabdus dicambivorans]|nr:bile acid:sodium symporter family protein [Rhizorhabdus dicambivorans]
MRRLIPDPFIIALLSAVGLAVFLPARAGFAGIVDEITTAAIVLLFFLHGVHLPRQAVMSSLVHWRLHSAILAATFVIFPLLGLALSKLLGPLLPAPLWLGVLFLCVLPSTVQSSIAFTSIAKGNIPGAVAAATLSNLAGIVLTPLLASLLLKSQGPGFSLSSVSKIFSELLLPFIVGQVMRIWLAEWATRRKKLLSLTDRSTILLAVYSAFSGVIVSGMLHGLAWSTLGSLIAICALLLALILLITLFGSRSLGFDRADEIAIVFCGSKKTLASGIPMARVLFAGPTLGAVVVPLMLFHQLQLMVCAWLSRRYARSTAASAAAPPTAFAKV